MIKKIMTVDDEPAISEMISSLLKREGFDVTVKHSGEECIRKVEEGFRGIILMDIMMPILSGWKTIELMHKKNLIQGNIILMLTALNDPGPEMDGLKEYVVDYIKKPFDAKEFIKIIKQYMNY